MFEIPRAYPPTPDDWQQAVPGDVRPLFLLTLNWAGATYRFSTVRLSMRNTAGAHDGARDLQFNGGLENPDFVEQANREGVSVGGMSIPLSVEFPDNLNIASQMKTRMPISSATGELRMLLRSPLAPVPPFGAGEPLSMDDTFLIMKGNLVMPVYAFPGQPSRLDFSLEKPVPQTNVTLLDPEGTITSRTWPYAKEQVHGKVYPTIIGHPGQYTTNREVVVLGAGFPFPTVSQNTEVNVPATPAYKVVESALTLDVRLLIAGHPVLAKQVWIWTENSLSPVAVDCYTDEDGLGRRVTLVQIFDIVPYIGIEIFYVSWPRSGPQDPLVWGFPKHSGGLQNPFGPGSLSALGDVMMWALSKTPEGLDLSKWQAETEMLNRISIDCYINDIKITPWEWIRNNLIELMALEIRDGPYGIFPRVRMWGTATRQTHTIFVDSDFYQNGPMLIETEIGEIRNRITLNYAPSIRDSARRIVTISKDAGGQRIYRVGATLTGVVYPGAACMDQYSSSYAVFSASRYGEKSETIESNLIYDDASAGLLLSERVRNLGFMSRTRPYIAASHYGWLQVGDFINLRAHFDRNAPDDDDLGLPNDGAVCEITAKSWNGSAWIFVLTFDDDELVQT